MIIQRLTAFHAERRPTFGANVRPALQLPIVQRLDFTASGQDQHSGGDQLMANMGPPGYSYCGAAP
jgi:hypothetical protein